MYERLRTVKTLMLFVSVGCSHPEESTQSTISDTSTGMISVHETSATTTTLETSITTTPTTPTTIPVEGGEHHFQLDCPIAAPEGLAVWVSWPASDKLRYGHTAPLMVRVPGASSDGWDLGHDPGLAVSQGAAVVHFLRPGTFDKDGSESGGTADFGGPSTHNSLVCLLEFIEGKRWGLGGESFGDFAIPTSDVITTGLSMGGIHVINALHTEAKGLARGAVIWESPLVDQVILQEFTPLGGADPLFEEGTCTLNIGCPFPGRGQYLRYDSASEQLYQDTNLDGQLQEKELSYRPLVPFDNGGSFYSMEMHQEVVGAGTDLVFGGTIPESWPSLTSVESFWRAWEAADSLRQIRDTGSDVAFIVLGSRHDHAQQLQEHLRLAQEGLVGADFFRFLPDASYLSGLGFETSMEVDAGVVVDDPVTLALLPDPRPDVQVLAAELELADRLHSSTWDADLSEPIFGVTQLEF